VRRALFALLLLATAASRPVDAEAQAGPRQGGPRPGGPGRGRDEAVRMIDAYIVSNLQESLDLTDEQFVKVLPLVKKLQTDRRAFAQRRQRALFELRRSFAAGSATEPRVLELLKEAKAVEAEEPVALRRDLETIDSALSPVQQAKFRVLEVEVERRIRELMARIRAERRGGRARPGSPEPDQP
jgi:hypothetical protein